MTAAGEQNGILVVRAWIEGDPPQLRARISHTVGLEEAEPEQTVAASAEQIHEEVSRWLAALEGGGAR